MKKMILILVVIFFSLQLHAQNLTLEAETVMKSVLAPNGVLTKETHEAFWIEMNKLGSEKEVQQVIDKIRNNRGSLQEYQKEMWSSAKMSFDNKKVIKTERLIELEKKLPKIFEESISIPKVSNNYKEALNAVRAKKKIVDENLAIMLDGAAKHKVITSVQGQVYNMKDSQLIDTVLGRLSASFDRFNNLLDKDWTPGSNN